jgi:hypothetical protein
MRPPIYDVYRMKTDRLPEGTKAVWLRTWPDERPASDNWTLIGRERFPSKWTVAEMDKNGFCFCEISNWIDSSKWPASK